MFQIPLRWTFTGNGWTKGPFTRITITALQLLKPFHFSILRYAHFAPDHATKRVIEVQKLEAVELATNRQPEGVKVSHVFTCHLLDEL